MQLCDEDFLQALKQNFARLFVCQMWVKEAIDKRFDVDKSGQIIFLSRACTWKEALFAHEKDLDKKILYVIFPDRDDSIRVQCVPIDSNSFTNRKSLKTEWQGKSQEELVSLTGIQDIIFCHHSGFIGGAKSYESALKMAQISLSEEWLIYPNYKSFIYPLL